MKIEREDLERVARAMCNAMQADDPSAMIIGDPGVTTTAIDGEFNMLKVARAAAIAFGMEVDDEVR